jgi:hypothetical protein
MLSYLDAELLCYLEALLLINIDIVSLWYLAVVLSRCSVSLLSRCRVMLSRCNFAMLSRVLSLCNPGSTVMLSRGSVVMLPTVILSVLPWGGVSILSKDNACFSLQLTLRHPIYLCLVLLNDLLPYEFSTASNYSFNHSCNTPGHLILLDLISLMIWEYKSSVLCMYFSPLPKDQQFPSTTCSLTPRSYCQHCLSDLILYKPRINVISPVTFQCTF